MSDLLAVSEAKSRLLAAAEPVGSESVALAQAGRRILAQPVVTALNLPPFDNSSMDGFAVLAADLAQAGPQTPVTLPVVADIPAGSQPTRHLERGQAARIMTGAMLPGGADTVVPLEDTDYRPAQAGQPAPQQVKIFRLLQAGDYVRRQGEDLRQGHQILAAGSALRPQDIGLLAMCGIPTVPVYRRPRVAILSTGDELVSPAEALGPGQIHESNGPMLAALVESFGGVALNLGVARDDPPAIRARLDQAIAFQADLILSSAGVSVGAYDYLRAVIAAHGSLDFWRVNMRPGKPLLVGDYRQTRLVGLPGNPVSAFVGFQVFVRPLLLRLAGSGEPDERLLTVHLADAIQSDGRESYLRAIIRQEGQVWMARLAGHQGSANLSALVQANGLLKIPAGVTALQPGAALQAWMFGQ